MFQDVPQAEQLSEKNLIILILIVKKKNVMELITENYGTYNIRLFIVRIRTYYVPSKKMNYMV